MKTVLGCLMCLVLTVAQGFAISGGPFQSTSQVTVTGTYAGVFVPIPTVFDPGPPEVTLTDNSLALFTFRVPKVGLASGDSAVFRNGIYYPGTIQGSADPDTAKVTGIISCSFQETVAETSSVNLVFVFSANGQFVNTHIVPNRGPAVSSARLRGKASITYTNSAGDPNGDSGGPIMYKVHGFKQSDASS